MYYTVYSRDENKVYFDLKEVQWSASITSSIRPSVYPLAHACTNLDILWLLLSCSQDLVAQ